MKKIPFFLIVLVMPLSFVQAQTLPDSKPLEIGDKVPEIVFNQLINYSSGSARLSDFKGKLVILDFWATWCGSCIHQFPKMDDLQQQFQDKLQFILVNNFTTGDTRSKVLNFITKRTQAGKPLKHLPIAVEDSVAIRYFPCKTLPHYVWINEEQQIIAITSALEVNAENIQEYLSSGKLGVTMKKDNEMLDRYQPLYLHAYTPLSQLDHYCIILKGRVKNYPMTEGVYLMEGGRKRISFTNNTLLNIYVTIASRLFPLSGADNRLQIHVRDIDDLRNRQEDHNYYTVDWITAEEDTEIAYRSLLEELNRHMPYRAEIVQDSIRCIVLSANPDFKESDSLTKSISSLKRAIRRIPFLAETPIIDSTGFSGNQLVAVKLPQNIQTFEALQHSLSRSRVKLSTEVRKVPVFLITDSL